MKTSKKKHGNLYVIVCGAYPAKDVHEFIEMAQYDGWEICVIVSKQAMSFIDASQIEELTNYPVRTHYKQPDTPDIFPAPDAIIVVPATFNTINKWALGISDNLGVGILCEHLGRGTPIIAVPWPNRDLARHPAYPRSIEILKNSGVHIIDEREIQNYSEDISWKNLLGQMNAYFLSKAPNDTAQIG